MQSDGGGSLSDAEADLRAFHAYNAAKSNHVDEEVAHITRTFLQRTFPDFNRNADCKKCVYQLLSAQHHMFACFTHGKIHTCSREHCRSKISLDNTGYFCPYSNYSFGYKIDFSKFGEGSNGVKRSSHTRKPPRLISMPAMVNLVFNTLIYDPGIRQKCITAEMERQWAAPPSDLDGLSYSAIVSAKPIAADVCIPPLPELKVLCEQIKSLWCALESETTTIQKRGKARDFTVYVLCVLQRTDLSHNGVVFIQTSPRIRMCMPSVTWSGIACRYTKNILESAYTNGNHIFHGSAERFLERGRSFDPVAFKRSNTPQKIVATAPQNNGEMSAECGLKRLRDEAEDNTKRKMNVVRHHTVHWQKQHEAKASADELGGAPADDRGRRFNNVVVRGAARVPAGNGFQLVRAVDARLRQT